MEEGINVNEKIIIKCEKGKILLLNSKDIKLCRIKRINTNMWSFEDTSKLKKCGIYFKSSKKMCQANIKWRKQEYQKNLNANHILYWWVKIY